MFDTTFDSNQGATAGAIANTGELDIYRSTFVNNSPGAIQSSETLTVENSTFSANTSGSGSWSALNIFGDADIAHATFVNNTGGAAVYVNSSATVDIGNTILSSIADSCTDWGTLVSLGGNIDNGTSCGFSEVTDQDNTDPDVEALATNGGLTQTHALSPTSPAINSGLWSICLDTDQRGVVRPDLECDVGAFELESE